MKYFLLSIAILIVGYLPVSAQETYSYYYASYSVEGANREMMVCKTEPFKWAGDKATGVSGVDYVPEANFRKWLDNNYGNKATGRDFYPCTSADQAIKYYKDFAVTYQQGNNPFKNSSYCPSIYTIAYVEPVKKSGSNTSISTSTESTYSAPTNSTSTSNTSTTETASQRQYREQRERTAEIQRQSEEQSKQLVQGATELVGIAGNMLATNRAIREKKLLKRAAAKSLEEQEKARKEEERRTDKQRIENYRSLGDDITIDQLVDLYRAYHNLGDYVNYKIELKRATDHFEALLVQPVVPSEPKQYIYESTQTGVDKESYNTGDSSILKILAQINSRAYGNYDDAVKWLNRYINYYENSSDPLIADRVMYYMYQLAQLYSNGEFDFYNMEQGNSERVKIPMAINWYTRVADKGKKNYTTKAMFSLYTIYLGRFTYTKPFKDKAKANEWYKKYKIADEAGL